MLNIPSKCIIVSNPFLGKSKLKFDGMGEDSKSVRFHNIISAFFLRIVGKIVDVKDAKGEIYHLNRGSLENLLQPDKNNAYPERLKLLTENEIRKLLNNVISQKAIPKKQENKIDAIKNEDIEIEAKKIEAVVQEVVLTPEEKFQQANKIVLSEKDRQEMDSILEDNMQLLYPLVENLNKRVKNGSFSWGMYGLFNKEAILRELKMRKYIHDYQEQGLIGTYLIYVKAEDKIPA